MKLINYQLYNINVTIKYEYLDRGLISRDGLRKLVPEGEEVIINDLPDVLLVIFPHSHIIIDEERVSINCPVEDNSEADFDLLADFTRKVVELIDKGRISAFGFNYAGKAECPEEIIVSEYFIKQFMKPNPQLETAFGGKITKVEPQFSLTRSDCTFNISLNTDSDPQAFKYNVNVHYSKNSLPPKQKISQMLSSQYEIYNNLIEKF